ncbi:MAG TPA: 50S ribosomal protein L17 [Candidatus Paceibacterota bacterium]|nr:50S ribosomal protein L17 [Candidatus Paceibacterota bacterium]HMP18751.1 50S ribosomal protein L17 [Candidatus Paceibacterota bacterium]HMP85312.1 50S ribosomal protein L17 [Candidatus Paceibacterota bacterium]
MRHHNRNKKLGRNRDGRRALLKSLACSIIRDEKIKTTEVKAKQLRPFIEKLVTKAKTDSVANKRHVLSVLGNKKQTQKLFSVVAPKYKEFKGGYTRITKLPNRLSDSSKMALIEFV